jgi:hypothetical protein
MTVPKIQSECMEKPAIGMPGYARCFKNIQWTGDVGNLAECPYCGTPFCTVSRFSGVITGIYVDGKGWVL